MSDIYVFGPKESDNDYSTMGLVGALTPESCVFKEKKNGDSIVELKHPLDSFGRYIALLTKGNILVVPVPVRTTPEIQNGTCVSTVWTYKVKPLNQLTSKSQRTLYKRSTGSSRKKIMQPGDILTVVQRYEDDDKRWKVKTKYGTGFVISGNANPSGIELVTEHILSPNNSESISEKTSAWTVTDQYFRIYEVKEGMDGVTVLARHISYDLLYNTTKCYSQNTHKLQEALSMIMDNTFADHEFSAQTNVENEQTGLFYRNRNPIDAFLNVDDGICKRYDVGLIRDNYDLYFLHDPGVNRGVYVQYGKNMTGIEFTSSDDEVATRIVPVGETKDGDPLYLVDNIDDPSTWGNDTPWIDSPNINKYPVIHVYILKCENAKVNSKDEDAGKVTKTIARERMRQQANDLIQNGCDQPKIAMSVEFLNIGDTKEYEQFKNIENCFLFDYLIVQHPLLYIDVTSQITGIEWDCLLKRLIACDIGSVGTTLANIGISTWQIPNGFSGSKIEWNTVGGGALQGDIINTKHLQAESVNAEKIAAGAVTAEKIAAGAITADKLDAKTVNTHILNAVLAKIETIVSGTLTTDELYAEFAKLNILIAGNATFDQATIKHLVAEAMNLEFGVANQVFIKNLAVQYAQMVGAAIGNLCIKSSDGNYYSIDVDQNGHVTATKTTVTEGEAAAGQTDAGKVILGTDITAENLNTTNLLATYALVNKIDAARIDVDELCAREAFIAKLNTSLIYGGKSLEIIVGEMTEAIEEMGNNLVDSYMEYYLSDSTSELIGGIWVKDNAPDWVDGKYMWCRMIYVRSDGKTVTGASACIAGSQGIPGTPGKDGSDGVDGISYYTWVKYADSSTGSGMSDNPSGKFYIGLAYNKTTPTESNVASDYTWSLFRGSDGLPGVDGSDGKTYYTWIKYADSPTSGMSDAPEGKNYMGVAYNKLTSTESSNYSDYNWSLIKGKDGSDGVDGRGISFITPYYALSTSKTSYSGVSWSTSMPSWSEGNFLWIRTMVTYTDGVSSWAGNPYCDSSWEAAVDAAQRYSIVTSDNPPTSPIINQFWMDTTSVPPTLKRYTGEDVSTGGWAPVTDLSTIESVERQILEEQATLRAEVQSLATHMKTDNIGVHVFKNKDKNEMLITDQDIQILVNGTAYSKFLALALQLGAFKLYSPSKGGLAFAPIN